MKRVIKNIIIILLIIIFIIVINSIRKYTILCALYDKAQLYVDSNNFKHRISQTVAGNYTKSIIYVLDDRFKIESIKIEEDKTINKNSYYYKNDDGTYTVDEYTVENGVNKSAVINRIIDASVNVINPLDHETNWQMIIASIISTVKSKTVNTEECYYVKSPIFVLTKFSEGLYISKETGLLVQQNDINDQIINHEYEFDIVSQDDFVEPDLTEFEEVRDISKEQGLGM